MGSEADCEYPLCLLTTGPETKNNNMKEKKGSFIDLNENETETLYW